MEYLDLWGGPHRFTPVFSVPALLGMTGEGCVRFVYGAVTHYGRPFQSRSTTQQLGNFVIDLMLDLLVPQPRVSNAIRLDTDTVWSVPFSLATTQGVAVAFLSSGY